MGTPFWSSETNGWAALCPVENEKDELASEMSWTKMWIGLGKDESRFPSLAPLGIPNFVPQVEGKKPPAQRVRKIKLKPTPEQKRILNGWFGTARWTYNQCLKAIEEYGCERSETALRASCINNDLWRERNCWVKQTPYDIRNAAMCDLLKAYQSNFAAKRKKFKMKYKSKKALSDSIVIHSKHWKAAGMFYPRTFGKVPVKACETLPDKLDYDTRLQRTRLGEFYLCLLSPLRTENQIPKHSVIALDPGVRTFQTGYSPQGSTFEFGRGDVARLARLCLELDKLQSKWSQPGVKHRQRCSFQKAARRLRERIHNLVHDLHHNVARFLCQCFGTILIPKFETQDMVCKVKRRIGSKTARMMLTWSHYRFRKILEDKARQFPGCAVFVVDEAFTSKTCGKCGNLHPNLGKNKTFHCPSCNFTLDRDINGARNILLRFMTEDARVRQAGLHWDLAPGHL